jgi:Glutathione S-transferase, C-terminal domain.
MRRHYDLKSIYGDSPIVVKACREHLDKHLKIIDNFIKNKKSILDKGFGLADIMLISCLDWAIYYELKLPDNIMSYRENIKKRPAFKKAMLVNYKSAEVVNNGTTYRHKNN